MVEKRECQNPSCGRVFNFKVKPSTKPSWGKYCSQPCKGESMRMGKIEERICQNQNCGRFFNFNVLPSNPSSFGKYCSRSCMIDSRSGKIEERICQNPSCGRVFEFKVYPSNVSGAGKYCNRSCRMESRAGKIEERECQSCGTVFEFKVKPSTRLWEGKYCNRSCTNNSFKKRIIGETKICIRCKKTLFSENYMQWRWKVVKLCDRECADKNQRKPAGSVRKDVVYLVEKVDIEHPFYSMGNIGWVLQHRLVMAEYLGRPLHNWETVHHIDRNPQNNDIKNLQLRIGAHGTGATYRCTDCDSDRIHPVKI